jgi:tyrosine-protein kinase Etk/Wzc
MAAAAPTRHSDELLISDYLFAVYRRRWVALAIFGVVLLAVVIRTLTTTPIYQAYALVQLKEETSQNLLLSDLAKLGKGNPLAAEMEIVHSRTVAESVARELRLDVVRADYPDGPVADLRDVDLAPERMDETLEIRVTGDGRAFDVVDGHGKPVGKGEVGVPFDQAGVRFLLASTDAESGDAIRFKQLPILEAAVAVQATLRVEEVGERTSILMLMYRHKDPVMAKDVTNKIVDVYLRKNREDKSLEASQTLEVIREQLEHIRTNLDASEANLHDYKQEKGIVLLSEEATLLLDQISRLEVEKAQIELDLFQARQVKEAMKTGRDIAGSYSLPELAKEEMLLSTLAVELAQKEVERKTLLEELTPEHPEVRAVAGAIQDLKQKIEQILDNTVRSLENRMGSIDGVLGGLNGRIQRLPTVERDMAALTRTTEVNENIYKFLLEKHEEARIAKAAVVGDLRVIDWAVIPDKPVRPKTKLDLILGFLAGLVLAGVAVFVLEWVDDSIKTLDEFERQVGQPVYGVIPRIALAPGEPPGKTLVTRTDPKSPIAESFRTLRTNIHFADPDRRIASLLVTSAGPSEGKSTIVSNLAIAIANMGVRTLLIDCDLRKPNLHNIFEADRDPGLTSAIMGEKPWRDGVRPSGVDNLSLLPSGPIPPNPTELLGSRHMVELLAEAKGEYDMVLLDSPPVIAVTDAAILSSLVDGTLLVVEVGRSRAQAVNRSVSLLENVKARLLGVVANHVVSSGLRYDYGYYSYYYTSEGGKKKRRGRHRRK